MGYRVGNLLEDFDQYWKYFAPATIAAPYCGPSPMQPVLMLQWDSLRGDNHPDRLMKMALIERHDAASRTGIGEVAAMGTGLILYDTRFFSIFPRPGLTTSTLTLTGLKDHLQRMFTRPETHRSWECLSTAPGIAGQATGSLSWLPSQIQSQWKW